MTTWAWHHILADKCILHSYPNMSVSASSVYFGEMPSKWQTTFMEFCELFPLSSQDTVNSSFYIASPTITNCDFSSSDHILTETCGMPLQDKVGEVKNETRPQVVSLLIKEVEERKVIHLSTTKRKHKIPARQKVRLCCLWLLQDSYHPQVGDRNKHITYVLDSFSKI